MNESAREIALIALIKWDKSGIFLQKTLDDWKKETSPSDRDVNLAYELSSGVVRKLRNLDFIAKTRIRKLPKKASEKMLLRLSLYQIYYLDKIPIYAVVDETVKLAKRHCSLFFANFLNATLKIFSKETLQTDVAEDLFSYTPYFCKKIIEHYGKSVGETILECGNRRPPIMARNRKTNRVEVIHSVKDVEKDKNYYIQNETLPNLYSQLAKTLLKAPTTILDVCAAPGGKSILLYDLFPKAVLFCNDPSKERLKILKDNLTKYEVRAEIFSEMGENLKKSSFPPLDLVVIDAPCSNSGALFKCPEARWRIEEEELNRLKQEQLKLLKNGASLIGKEGLIFYSTCSILPSENEEVINFACENFGLKLLTKPLLQLPTLSGLEGGFACVLISDM